MGSIIEVINVSKSYKNIQALTNISLTVEPGQIFGLIGPDGAGKSTLIHIITGVLSAKQGTVRVLGKNVLANPESIKTAIGFLPQGLGLSLAQELSVEENINFFAKINQVDSKNLHKRKELLLQATQLDPFKDRPAKNLSGGMKQKLALCCTLIHEPELIFLDEPTTGVDPISRSDIWALINNMIKEKNLTVFLTTSYMDEAARCNHIVLMHNGKIIEEGQPDTLAAKLDGKFVEVIVDDQHKTLAALKKIQEVKLAYPVGDKINVIYKDIEIEQIKTLVQKEKVIFKDVQHSVPGVEDIFLSKLAREKEEVNEEVFNDFFRRNQQSDSFLAKSDNKVEMIRAQNLEKRFGDFIAVNKVSFSVKRGEVFGFLGPNGAGKTTTIKMLCGLFPPTSGVGMIAGLDLFKQQFQIKKSIGYMSQKFSLYRDMTVAENIELYGGIYDVPYKELILRRDLIMKIADLEGKGDFITADLPMGIKQRLALGCAIIHKPECIFLDEPTSGVDPIARRKFWDIIFILSRKMNVTILVTTHYMDEAQQCDRVSLMTRGELVAIGEPNNLKQEVNNEIGLLLELTTSDPFASVDKLKRHFGHCLIYGSKVHVYTKKYQEDILMIKDILGKNQIILKDIRQKVMPFEDVFIYFCQRGQK